MRAHSGTEALARLMENEFAVILLDVNMPGMDGFETANLIHQHPRFEKTPIIFVTGIHVTDLDKLKGYKLGAVDYVYVPVVPEILRSKVCVLVDDIVDTAGTLCAAAAALKNHGARKVVAYCTHPVLSGPAIRNLNGSQLDELVVTDTIPLTDEARNCGRIRQLGVAELLAETIRRIAYGESVSSLYVD